MPKSHTVRQGECFSSIAFEHGFFASTLWKHADNKTLRRKRGQMNLLSEGDVVSIPDLEQRTKQCATGSSHKFRRKGVPAVLRLRVQELGEPIANAPFELHLDGEILKGETDDNGDLEIGIPPSATRGRLLVGEGDSAREYELDLGHIDPIEELTGVQGRLANLGFDPGPIDGVAGPKLKAAIERFQALNDLEVTGEVDDTTRSELEAQHDDAS